MKRARFIATLMPAAIEASKRTGVDPRIIIAQAAQETGWGEHAPNNNYFGIKSHGKSGGQTFGTTEVVNGRRVREQASFRGYGSPEESVAGYADFLLENPRYENFRRAVGLDAQAAALQASGYATDPNYGNTVRNIAGGIEMGGSYAPVDSRGLALPGQPDPSIDLYNRPPATPSPDVFTGGNMAPNPDVTPAAKKGPKGKFGEAMASGEGMGQQQGTTVSDLPKAALFQAQPTTVGDPQELAARKDKLARLLVRLQQNTLVG